jgi:hypothetical protein
LKPGERIRRTILHEEFGGRRQGGISPSRATPNVFIFSDPAAGEPHGYYDGWEADGCFHYTGEGQRGDQELKSGNAAILRHVADDRVLRLFEGARGTVRYEGEFEIDTDQPFYRTDGHETGGGPSREVIVFRLRPTSSPPQEPTSKLAPLLSGPSNVGVPIEQQHTEKAYVDPSREPYETERREQKLLLSLADHLRELGHDVYRHRIIPPGEARPIFTDLYDATTGVLVEAKGSGERSSIRMAIGQLADYSRFLDHGPEHLAVLLPREPRQDLRDLLFGQGIDVIYPNASGFSDSSGGALVS